jgi:hypothetical protein
VAAEDLYNCSSDRVKKRSRRPVISNSARLQGLVCLPLCGLCTARRAPMRTTTAFGVTLAVMNFGGIELLFELLYYPSNLKRVEERELL